MSRPDYWVALNDLNDDGFGASEIYLDPTVGGLHLIQTKSEPPHDLIKLYDHEVADLITRLVEYLDGDM